MRKRIKLGKDPLGGIAEINLEEGIIMYNIENKEKELEFRNVLYTQLLKEDKEGDVQVYEYNQTDGYSWEALKNNQVHLREKRQLLQDKKLYQGEGDKIVHIKDSEGVESIIRQYVQEIKKGVFKDTTLLVRVRGGVDEYVRVIDEVGREGITGIIYSGDKGFSVGMKLFRVPIPINEGDSEIVVKDRGYLIPKRVQLFKMIEGDKDLPFKKLEFEV